MRRPIAAAALVVTLGLAGSACSDDGSVARADRAVEATAIPAPAGVSAAGVELTLEVVDGGPSTGRVITDHRGFAVYGVTGESLGGDPVCTDECLDVWLPVEPRAGTVTEALDESQYEILRRPDGIEQAVYAGVPLYTWSGDRQVGITAGAGVAGTWFALTAAGGFLD